MNDKLLDDVDPTAPGSRGTTGPGSATGGARSATARPATSGTTPAPTHSHRGPRPIGSLARLGSPWLIGLTVAAGIATLALATPAFAGPTPGHPVAVTDPGPPDSAIEPAVLVAPAAPTAVAGDGQVTVTIVRRSGESSFNYRVQETGDNSFWCAIDTAHTTCTIQSLRNDVSYTFQAYSYTSTDESTWSDPSNAVTPTAPASPTPTATPTATGTPTPTASPTGPGHALLTLPARILSSVGDSATMPVNCAISSGTLARCVVTTTAVVSGETVTVGYGVATPTLTQNVQKVSVTTVLTDVGRYLAARAGGFQADVTAEVIQRDVAGNTTAEGRTNVVAQRYQLPRSVGFNVDSAKVVSSEKAYLTLARGKVTAATAISCSGHADSRERGRSTLGVRRARAACDVIARDLHATVHAYGTVDLHPVGVHNTAAIRALNRRVDITITN